MRMIIGAYEIINDEFYRDAGSVKTLHKSDVDTATRRLSKFVDGFVDGSAKEEYTQLLGETPTVLQFLGAEPLQIQIDGETVKKVIAGKHKYFITVDMLKALPEHLYNPLAVFKNKETGGKIVLTEMQDAVNKSPVVIAIHLSKVASGRMKINNIASVFGADAYSANKYFTPESIEYYRNKESLEQSTVRHLNTPLVDTVQSAQDLGRIVYTEDDVVNKFGTRVLVSDNPDRWAVKEADVEKGCYRGVVIDDVGARVVQNQGKGTVVAHEKGRLEGEVVVGRNVEIGYEGGRGVVKSLEREVGVEKGR